MKYLFFLLLLLSGLSKEGNSQTISLEEILQKIQHEHPSLKMIDADIQSMDAAAAGAKSWMSPTVSTGLWMVPYDVKKWKADGMGATGMGQYMISAEQMFPNKKYQTANSVYMKAMSAASRETAKATYNDLVAEAKKNYYEWLVIEKRLNILNQNETLLRYMIKNAEIRFKNGLEKINAYYKAQAALGSMQSMRVMLENERTQKQIALNTLMNREKSSRWTIDTAYELKEYPVLNDDKNLFYQTRSEIKAIDREITLTGLKQQVEKAALRPQFGIRYDHMFGFGGLPMQYSLMGMMKIPLNWSTPMNKAEIESLHWKAVSLEKQKEMLANEYSGMAAGMQEELHAKKKQLQLYENTILPAMRKNFQATLLAYEQNTEDLFMLYDAWESLNMTQLGYLDQLQQLLVLQVQYEKIFEIK